MTALTHPRVLIIAGGLTHEREISVRSGRRVADMLRSAGCDVEISDLDDRVLSELQDHRPDVVWPLLHGATGEDGSVRDVLELAGVPYVGSIPTACRHTWDKPIAKALVRRAGVPTPHSVALPHSVFRELGAADLLEMLRIGLGMPLAVKPARGGSALGVSVVQDAAQLPGAMVDCFAYGDEALVERAVIGREVAASVVDLGGGPTVLPLVEIETAGGPYDYDARYNTGRTEYFVPARLDDETSGAVMEHALAAYGALGLRDIARFDFIVDDEGVPWFLEANVAPGMTEVSLLPQAAQGAGHDLGKLYRQLVEVAIAHG
ncbi:MAG TPA: D-alanine--D-alanine ligase [Actinomycetales bacterium]|nr:D-alanine--D-alanine ligase [Actinomycetales bacterium]